MRAPYPADRVRPGEPRPGPWPRCRADGHLPRGAVHAWKLDLHRLRARGDDLLALLDEGELARWGRYPYPADRERFAIRRGALRAILGRYLDRDPRGIRIAPGPRGKPQLAGPGDRDVVQFNVSHSGAVALVAVRRDGPVGVDVERIRADVAVERIAARFFSADEVSSLRGLSGDLRREGFFRCFARKEAYLKGRGEGLLFPLDSFAAPVERGYPRAPVPATWAPPAAARWTMVDLDPAPGYASSLLVEGNIEDVACREWSL